MRTDIPYEENSHSLNKRNGFTLIELLAVIIILGILLIIAMPSVTKYIQESRKDSYVVTAKEYTGGIRNKVNSSEFDFFDPNITYYVPNTCVKLESGGDSPFGKFVDGQTYVVVTYDGNGFNYYWTSKDESNMGIYLTDEELLDTDKIQSNMGEISTDVGIGEREKIKVLGNSCKLEDAIEKDARVNIDDKGIFDGVIPEIPTLYNVLQKEAKEGKYAKEYTGAHQDSMAGSGSKKIYHWYAGYGVNTNDILDKNNVLFAGFCWQMIRTTDTGGVKMIYNGEPDSEGRCLSTRSNHTGVSGGYSGYTSKSLSGKYKYGTSYTYDKINRTFTLKNTGTAIWNDTTYKNLIGKYTCGTASDSCTTLYQVNGYYSSTTAYVAIHKVENSVSYSQIGTSIFNANYTSPAMVGYMFGNSYNYNSIRETENQSFGGTEILLSSANLDTTYWYSDNISYGSPESYRYNLINPYQISSAADYPNLVGKYTLKNTSKTYTNSSAYYIAGVDNTRMYYKELYNGYLLSKFEPIVFGDSISENADGTYTLNNTTSVTLKEWYTDYATYKNKYTCGDSSITCSKPKYISETGNDYYTYINAGEKILIAKQRNGMNLKETLLISREELIKNRDNYTDYKYTCNTTSDSCTEETLRLITSYSKTGYNYANNHYWGSSVTWDGSNYTLVNPVEIENYNNLSTHHYMCVEKGLKKCSKVAYVYYNEYGNLLYILLENGVSSVEEALKEMLEGNKYNSSIKGVIDAWYEMNMMAYSDYLEDTIFCNNRSIQNLGGWNPNGGSLSGYLEFKESTATRDLSCPNETDRFSVNNPKAKLKYKIGLFSRPEIDLINKVILRDMRHYSWLASPYRFDSQFANEHSAMLVTSVHTYRVYAVNGIRPAISLKPEIEYSSGDGSREKPYIIE